MNEDALTHLLSLSKRKKLAFLILLYERMIPELKDFCLAQKIDGSVFEKARQEFWASLTNKDSSISWSRLSEEMLHAIPDSENCGTLSASFALNAALVAAETAAFVTDGQNDHIIQAIGYARDSVDAKAASEIDAVVYDENVEAYIKRHPLLERESRVSSEDISFLSKIPSDKWTREVINTLQHRASRQAGLLN